MIAPNVVLTAAHCDPSGSSYVGRDVYVGAMSRGDSAATKVKVIGQYNHPNYNGDTEQYDFAILRLASSVITTGPVVEISKDEEDIFYIIPTATLNASRRTRIILSRLIQIVCSVLEWSVGVKILAREIDSGGPIVKIEGNVHKLVGVVS